LATWTPISTQLLGRAAERLLIFGGLLTLILAIHAERLIRPLATAGLLLAFTLLDLWVADSGLVRFVDPAQFLHPEHGQHSGAPTDSNYRVLTLNLRSVYYRNGHGDRRLL